MRIYRYPNNYFEENCYILHNEATGEVAVIDPGMMHNRDYAGFNEALSQLSPLPPAPIKHILLTHLHIDHVAGVDWLLEQPEAREAQVMASGDDDYLRSRLAEQVQYFRLRIAAPQVKIDTRLSADEEIELLGEKMNVIATPGHSRGSLSFYFPESNVVFTGDTLFAGSVGRIDLPGGDFDTIKASVTDLLNRLPDDTLVCSGHGETTTIGHERQFNPIARFP